MAKKQTANAYGVLIRIMIVLFVLVLLCVAGSWLIQQSIQAQKEENQALADEKNAQLQADYDQAMQEQAAQALIDAELAAQWPAPKSEGWDVVDLTGYSIQNPVSVTVSREDLLTGGMMLLNHWHSVPADFPEYLITSLNSVTKKVPFKDATVSLFPVAISALEELLEAAKAEGYEGYVINEGFRTNAAQQELYDNEANKAKYTDHYTGDALIEQVRKVVNYPGTSEYQSGFSFNVNRYLKDDPIMDYEFQDLEMSDWLLEHSWEYGIVFRFPVQGYPNDTVTDKSYKTGESRKMSIYRYVGKANAAVMHIMNFCMEEYIEYLMEHPHIAVYENGELRYEIIRQEIGYNTGDVVITICAECWDSYSASIDNMSGEVAGVIITMSY